MMESLVKKMVMADNHDGLAQKHGESTEKTVIIRYNK
jgi:hypothetical protein